MPGKDPHTETLASMTFSMHVYTASFLENTCFILIYFTPMHFPDLSVSSQREGLFITASSPTLGLWREGADVGYPASPPEVELATPPREGNDT